MVAVDSLVIVYIVIVHRLLKATVQLHVHTVKGTCAF